MTENLPCAEGWQIYEAFLTASPQEQGLLSGQWQSHQTTCSQCQKISEFAALPQTLAALQAWESVPISADFEARLFAKMAAQTPIRPAINWRFWERCFDFLHLPALAIVMGLFIWLPNQFSAPETLALKRPAIQSHKPLAEVLHTPTQNLLEHLKNSYQQRSKQG